MIWVFTLLSKIVNFILSYLIVIYFHLINDEFIFFVCVCMWKLTHLGEFKTSTSLITQKFIPILFLCLSSFSLLPSPPFSGTRALMHAWNAIRK